ncbi:MAG: protein translocase subunit SecF, partial [Acidobacteriota bacterium]
KWIFISISLILTVIAGVSIVLGGLNLGVDFTGGTLVYVKFKEEPQLERIREILSEAALQAEEVIRFDDPSLNEVQIRMAAVESEEAQVVTLENNQIFEALRQEYDQSQVETGRIDLNNISKSRLSTSLQELDPEGLRDEQSISEFSEHYGEQADKIIDYRTNQSGMIRDFSELDSLGIPTEVAETLRGASYLGSFTVISVESVGPKVGDELRSRARAAIGFSLIGMLGYIAVRFWPIYGFAALVALFHDVFITLGIFSLTGREISLTVVAALLTLVGYSINDTIVVFDRVRENLRLMRRSDLGTIINASINQTLNRTIMTSGMTFLAVFSLYLFGGQVLQGFSFALVIGIIVGTYSSIAIASPIVLWWQSYLDRKKARS